MTPDRRIAGLSGRHNCTNLRRFTTLKTKVQMIQDSSKVYLDIMNNRRSDMHEVAIVVLISLEIVVMLIQIGVDAGVIGETDIPTLAPTYPLPQALLPTLLSEPM